MNILEKIALVGIILCLIGSGFIIGMFKGRDMCVSYAENIACEERPKCPECEEFDLSYCPTCVSDIRYISQDCPPVDPLEDIYVMDLEDRLTKAMDLIKVQGATIEVMQKIMELE